MSTNSKPTDSAPSSCKPKKKRISTEVITSHVVIRSPAHTLGFKLEIQPSDEPDFVVKAVDIN